MNLALSPAEHAFRAEVRAFLAAELTSDLQAGQAASIGIYPDPEIALEWQRKLAVRGWAAPAWPVEFGGTGWTALERFIFESECALAGAPIVYPIGLRLAAPVIIAFGSPQQKSMWLPRILSGEDYWCQGFSEPGAGSDLAALSTRAEDRGDHYLVNGSKLWTTHAHHANWMFALVRTANTERRQDGISFLAIPMDAPGVVVRPIVSIGGDHDVNEVFFSDVVVAKDNLVGEENKGWAYAKYLLEFERGTGLFSSRLRSGLKRVEAALPTTPDASQRRRIAQVAMDIDVFEMLELMTLGTLPNGASPGPLASVLKLRSSRLKQSVAELGMDLLGREALRREDTLPGVLVSDYLNSRAATIFGGSSEVQLGIIARVIGGL